MSPEFAVEQSTLQTYQHLIQWISNLCLHLFASLPEFKHRKGPGYDLINNKSNLGMLRELLFLIRLWGSTNPGILPSYTKTSEQFDVKILKIVLKNSCFIQSHSEPENLKKSRPKKLMKSNTSNSWIIFLTKLHFSAISKMAKNQFLNWEKF